jgi:hypothetical protein
MKSYKWHLMISLIHEELDVNKCDWLFIQFFPSNIYIYGVKIGAFGSKFAFNNFMLLIGSKLVKVSYVNRKPWNK